VNTIRKALLRLLLKGVWGVPYTDPVTREFCLYLSLEEATAAHALYLDRYRDADFQVGPPYAIVGPLRLPGWEGRRRNLKWRS